MTYDIFISYKRRRTSSATAAYLYELLLNKGYNADIAVSVPSVTL